MQDNIYNKKKTNIGDFAFDQKVADVFDDMLNRSVPGYRSIINMLGVIAEQYVKPETNCYDLGCSLGAGTISIAQNIKGKKCRIIAVDNSHAMIDQCTDNIKKQDLFSTIDVICADIFDVKIENASMVVLNLVLQFVEPEKRRILLEQIYKGLNKEGIVFITEKIAFDDPKEEQVQTESYYAFKKLNGYSNLEISQKRTALEKVLVPDTIETHKRRLQKAGFSNVFVWFQCFNFVSMIAIK